MVSMHAQIVGSDAGRERFVDHKSRDTLDNRGFNLRYADMSQSAANTGVSVNKTSRFRGVSIYIDGVRWKSQLSYRNRKIGLGIHVDEVYAAKLYDAACMFLHGEFAVLNFPDESICSLSDSIRVSLQQRLQKYKDRGDLPTATAS